MQQRTGSILAVDFGNVSTRAVLIDVVEGVYQLVAQAHTLTTAGFPSGDIGVGLRQALHILNGTTSRRFLNDDGDLIMPEENDRAGVDTFIATASMGRPLRTVVIGLVHDVSVASARRATSGTYVDVVETVTLDDARSEESLINAIVHARPDLIFIVGGTERGAREPVMRLARLARLAVALITAYRKPSVLYAGNSQIAADVRALFDGLTTLFLAPNVRPTLDEESLEAAQLQLALAYDSAASSAGAGFEAVAALTALGILPTAQSYSLMVDYLARATESGVVAIDIGSAVGTLSASLNGTVGASIRTDIGVGHSAAALVAAVGVDAVRAWLPFTITRAELDTYTLNKTLRPATVPETIRELYIEFALARAGMRALVRAASPIWDPSLADAVDTPLPPFNNAIGAGSPIAQTGRAGLSALLLLDGLLPVGVVTLYADPAALVPVLGALARTNPAAVVQVLESGGLERLGTAVCLDGAVRPGRPALHLRLTLPDGSVVERDIDGGHVWIYPLPGGSKATLEVRALAGTLGGKRRLKIDVDGGTAGVVFDTRGRPFVPAADVRARAAQLTLWHSEASGDAEHTPGDDWFTPVVDAVPLLDAAPAAPARRGRRARPARAAAAGRGRGRRGGDAAPAAPADQPAQKDEVDELRNLFS